MIKLYGMGSPNVVKIYIALEELGLSYDVAPVDVFTGKQFDELVENDLLRDVDQLRCRPRVIVRLEIQIGERIEAMRVESRRDHDELRLSRTQRR